MSDDIYLGQRNSNRGCLVIIITALVLALVVFGYLRNRSVKQGKMDDSPTASIENTAESAGENAGKEATESTRPPAPPKSSDTQLLAQAREAKENQNFAQARKLALELLSQSQHPRSRRSAEDLLSEMATALAFTRIPLPEKVDITIKSGDTLGELAKKHKTTVELIRKSNSLKGSLIRVGDRLRILSGKWTITVSKSKNDLALYLNGQFFKRYSVGTGAHGMTPVGDFEVNDRIAQPTWWRGDGKAIPYGHPENLLGTHWLSLNVRGYGIHGTWEPESIGKQASAGCVRMLNEEVEELFAIVPLGTQVKIIE